MGGVEYQVTKVDPTDPHTKGAVYQVHKVSEEIAATLGGKVYRARIINDPTAPTVAGKVYQIVLIGDPSDPAVKGKVYNAILTGGSEAVVVGPAVSPLVLPDAVAGELDYVKAYGGTEQNGTPTPDTPVDIVSNNGVLKYGAIGKNLLNLDASGVIYGDFISNQGTVVHDNTSTISDFIPCTEGAYYTAQVVAWASGSNLRIHGYDENKNWVQMLTKSPASVGVITTATCQIPAEIKYIKVCGYMTGSVGEDAMLEFGSTATPYEPYIAGIYADGTVETINAHGKNLLDMATENIVLGKYINNNGVVSDSGPNFYNSKYIPVVAGGVYTWSTSSSISYFSVMEYDSNYVFKKRTLFSNAGTSGSITLRSDTAFVLIGSNMDSTDVTLDKIAAVDWQFEKGSTATEYQPYYDGGTATAEMLLKVGDYQDEQEILSGAVTRNIGIKVLDSSLEWTYDSTYGRVNATIPNLWGSTVARTVPGFCTHFEWLSHQESISSITPGQCYSAGANRIFLHISQTSAAAFSAWLDAQKDAGTPVIIVFPLENATTESVAGQTLQVTDGDNTLEITQASLSGLELEAEYTKVA